ncbi:MAG TPA: NAD(P)H-binding protein [Candidatus Corynebacterium avicola]|uniref:NAD(P)H-binding protein n=1 Tax=Candidatus Corynebacterium avicola TaxID=2838527 RepID=A0A9D1RPH2_9CORY|nr:NAD(P)H-binding protein [Candidatus Corynebacterium avicola]
MNITILGATGMVGTRLVTEAVSRGHQVTAAARHPRDSGAASILGLDAASPTDLDTALEDADAAVLTIKAVPETPGAIERHAAMTSTVLDAAHRHGVLLLVIGGAGPLRSPDHQELLVVDDPRYVQEKWRDIARASVRQLEACRRHEEADWVYLSPPAVLEPGERTGSYRRGVDTLLIDTGGASRISAEDLAVAALDELENPSADRHITVAQA